MNPRPPIRVADIARFDTLIDARSPAEFAQDHIPGALNCPVLNDHERSVIGTMYKQVGAFEAKRLGAAMVAANLARHLRDTFADKPAHWKPLIYCWRGGLRSGSMVTWLRLVGWDAQPLAGGYKAFRHHVMAQIDSLCPQLDLRIVCGATGSAKTRLLGHLAQAGAQVLDLEALACHKGSLLGALPGVAQPGQKAFETRLVHVLASFDLEQPVFVEGESPKIGQVALPPPLVRRMREARCLELQATPEARLDYLLRDYHYLGQDPAALAQQLGLLRSLRGGETVLRWQRWVHDGKLDALFAELMALHYDPLYDASQTRHFRHWRDRRRLPIGWLDDAELAALAKTLVGDEV